MISPQAKRLRSALGALGLRPHVRTRRTMAGYGPAWAVTHLSAYQREALEKQGYTVRAHPESTTGVCVVES